MKAYQVILQLMKHPFKEVRMMSTIVTGVWYNRENKEFDFTSINHDKTVYDPEKMNDTQLFERYIRNRNEIYALPDRLERIKSYQKQIFEIAKNRPELQKYIDFHEKYNINELERSVRENRVSRNNSVGEQ